MERAKAVPTPHLSPAERFHSWFDATVNQTNVRVVPMKDGKPRFRPMPEHDQWGPLVPANLYFKQRNDTVQDYAYREFGFPLRFFYHNRAQELFNRFQELTFEDLANPEANMNEQEAENWIQFCKKFAGEEFQEPTTEIVALVQKHLHNLGFHTTRYEVQDFLTTMNQKLMKKCFSVGDTSKKWLRKQLIKAHNQHRTSIDQTLLAMLDSIAYTEIGTPATDDIPTYHYEVPTPDGADLPEPIWEEEEEEKEKPQPTTKPAPKEQPQDNQKSWDSQGNWQSWGNQTYHPAQSSTDRPANVPAHGGSYVGNHMAGHKPSYQYMYGKPPTKKGEESSYQPHWYVDNIKVDLPPNMHGTDFVTRNLAGKVMDDAHMLCVTHAINHEGCLTRASCGCLHVHAATRARNQNRQATSRVCAEYMFNLSCKNGANCSFAHVDLQEWNRYNNTKPDNRKGVFVPANFVPYHQPQPDWTTPEMRSLKELDRQRREREHQRFVEANKPHRDAPPVNLPQGWITENQGEETEVSNKRKQPTTKRKSTNRKSTRRHSGATPPRYRSSSRSSSSSRNQSARSHRPTKPKSKRRSPSRRDRRDDRDDQRSRRRSSCGTYRRSDTRRDDRDYVRRQDRNYDRRDDRDDYRKDRHRRHDSTKRQHSRGESNHRYNRR
jgi:hypothetical protein